MYTFYFEIELEEPEDSILSGTMDQGQDEIGEDGVKKRKPRRVFGLGENLLIELFTYLIRFSCNSNRSVYNSIFILDLFNLS